MKKKTKYILNRQISKLLADVHERRFQALADSNYEYLNILDLRYKKLSNKLKNI